MILAVATDNVVDY